MTSDTRSVSGSHQDIVIGNVLGTIASEDALRVRMLCSDSYLIMALPRLTTARSREARIYSRWIMIRTRSLGDRWVSRSKSLPWTSVGIGLVSTVISEIFGVVCSKLELSVMRPQMSRGSSPTAECGTPPVQLLTDPRQSIVSVQERRAFYPTNTGCERLPNNRTH